MNTDKFSEIICNFRSLHLEFGNKLFDVLLRSGGAKFLLKLKTNIQIAFVESTQLKALRAEREYVFNIHTFETFKK